MAQANDGSDRGMLTSRRLWTAAIVLFVALEGLGLQMRGPLLPIFGDQWGISEGAQGLVSPAGTLGFAVTILIAGAIAGRIDTRRYFLGGILVTIVGVVGMALAPFFVAYLGFLLLRGLGTGVSRGLDRPLLSHLYPNARGRVFNLYDMAWAIGAAAGPVVLSIAVAIGDWRYAYGALAVAFGLVAALVWHLETPADDAEEELDLSAAGDLVRTPAVAATIVGLVFHTGLEGGMFLWLPTFGRDIAGLSSTRANLLLSAFTVAYIPGRFVYTLIAERVPYGPLVVALEILIVPVFLWTFFVAEGTIVFAGVALLGVLVSGIFPTLLAFGTQAAPEYSAPINAISTSTASVSMAIVPVAMGALAGVYSIRTAMWVPLALTVLVAPTVLIARRIDPNI
ncbi:MFS family permease [Halapricum desulfuricans]|uniref:MFS family permease n=1 Tax=Halapricum desulfuricans TaxID=2841257 RepID=A0A897NDT3_9EURY|nr:MFS transporter [Halapricum desulfuricans]QSG10832.1 MFS family permease [Halapricum desulfuricans]